MPTVAPSGTYTQRRGQLLEYFDRTAVDAWKKLTSDAPVNRIRATVRAGRDAMRATLLGYLPDDMTGQRLLDAGCGTGALAIEAAARGAHVVAIDLSPSLVEMAASRTPAALVGRIEYRSGDMLDAALGCFDHVVAMDSLIHYRPSDVVRALATLAPRTGDAMLFTFAPRTPLLMAMHTAGKLFPRADRSPAIVPVAPRRIARLIAANTELTGWQPHRTRRIDSLFYKSQALELRRQGEWRP
jgi:magnesium-protoporphyrin O-methyltransferase